MSKKDLLDELWWETWTPHEGVVERGAAVRLVLPRADKQHYSNAQIDDYGPGRGLMWRPPLTLTVQARFSHEQGPPGGTAGFGLWNDPGGARTRRIRPPQAVWFFHAAPPNNLDLDSLAPGQGWFAMTMDAAQWRVAPLLAAAPLGLPLMWIPALRRRFWPLGQAALRTRIAPVRGSMNRWRTYQIEWLPTRTRFFVDGETILDTPYSPGGPLGLVLWIDNQYAIVRPTGYIAGGRVDLHEPAWLELQNLSVAHPEPV